MSSGSNDIEKSEEQQVPLTGSEKRVFHPRTLLTKWKQKRPRWLVECVAEMIGTGIYTWAGVGSTVSFFLSTAGKQAGFGDLLTVGFAYALGIAFGIIVAAPVSGGHLHAGFTIAFALNGRFPWKKVPYYILSQVLGAFLACLIVYSQYRQQLKLATTGFAALGGNAAVFSPTGPAGVLAIFPTVGSKMGQVFWNELCATTFLSLAVFSIIDHQHNPFVSFTTGPLWIGAAYAVCIWSFALGTTALNPSRDFGGRLAAAAVFGREAFTQFPKYTAIGSLTGILGTICGAGVHTLFIADEKRSLHAHLGGASVSAVDIEH